MTPHSDPRMLSNEALEMAIAMGLEIQFEQSKNMWMKSAANSNCAEGERLSYMSGGCRYRLVKK